MDIVAVGNTEGCNFALGVFVPLGRATCMALQCGLALPIVETIIGMIRGGTNYRIYMDFHF
jgi:hypothetical protein